MIIHRMIGGCLYTFRWLSPGWAVSKASDSKYGFNAMLRVGHTYHVQTQPDGLPSKCSCQSSKWHGRCKHMDEAQVIKDEGWLSPIHLSGKE